MYVGMCCFGLVKLIGFELIYGVLSWWRPIDVMVGINFARFNYIYVQSIEDLTIYLIKDGNLHKFFLKKFLIWNITMK